VDSNHLPRFVFGQNTVVARVGRKPSEAGTSTALPRLVSNHLRPIERPQASTGVGDAYALMPPWELPRLPAFESDAGSAKHDLNSEGARKVDGRWK